jgi:hypothetical protein
MPHYFQLHNLKVAADTRKATIALPTTSSAQGSHLRIKRSFMKKIVFGAITSALVLSACGPMPTPIAKVKLRVAHLSPDAPAVDVCLKATSATAYTQPTLKGIGVTAGLSFAQITKALEVDAGTYDIKIVAPNAADCSTSLAGLPEYKGNVLNAGTSVTVAAVGLVAGTNAQGFTLKAFLNDTVAAATGKTKLRIIHASPDTPAVDVGTGSAANFVALATNTEYQNVWSLGYAAIDKLTDATLAVRATGAASDALVLTGITTAGADTFTGWAIGQLAGTGEKRLSVLLCSESDNPTTALSTCSRLPAATQ